MHVKRNNLSETQIKLTITAVEPDLAIYKSKVLHKLAAQVKLPGFRQGTAPINLVEKNVDQNQLQTEFLDMALTELYAKAAQAENVRPVTRPDVTIKKFVPFTELEYEVTTHVIGKVKLPNQIYLAKKK